MREAKKIVAIFGLILCLFGPRLALTADSWLDRAQVGGLNQIGTEAYGENGEPSRTLPAIIGAIVKVFLGLLGIIFVVLLIVAGFKYMTAAGDESKVEEAVKQIRNAVIGLIIVLTAYSITFYLTREVIPEITNS